MEYKVYPEYLKENRSKNFIIVMDEAGRNFTGHRSAVCRAMSMGLSMPGLHF